MGIEHQRRDLNRQLPHLSSLQGNVEAKVLGIAKKEFHFSFSLVFYAVTTLYFESSKEDELQADLFKIFEKLKEEEIGHGKHEEFHVMLEDLKEIYLK